MVAWSDERKVTLHQSICLDALRRSSISGDHLKKERKVTLMTYAVHLNKYFDVM